MIPVACTAPMNAELINSFLTTTYAGYPEAAQDLVILTTLDWTHYSHNEAQLNPFEALKQNSKVLLHGGGPMVVPSRPPWTLNFSSSNPFEGKTPEDVARLLRAEAPSSLDTRFCAILDEQSVKDKKTVLLVKTQRSAGDNLPPGCEDWEIVKVREEWKEANGVLQSVASGAGGSLEEVLWNRQNVKKEKS